MVLEMYLIKMDDDRVLPWVGVSMISSPHLLDLRNNRLFAGIKYRLRTKVHRHNVLCDTEP